MQTILIETKDVSDFNLIKALLEKMKIRMKVLNLSDEEKEDLGLLALMQEVDWQETVPVEDVLAKLRKRKQIAA